MPSLVLIARTYVRTYLLPTYVKQLALAYAERRALRRVALIAEFADVRSYIRAASDVHPM